MTKITQIEDKGATIAWSPMAGYPDVIALGTKDSGGSGFDDTGGELDLYDLNLTSPDGNTPTPKLLGSVKTASRFASVAWTTGGANLVDRFSMGLLAGGMTDGTVHVWNPTAVIMQQPDSVLLATLPKCVAGPIKSLQFSPLNAAQMAFGGANGQVLVADLSQPEKPTLVAPCDDHKQSGEITSVAWNTQVGHIVASAAGDGSVAVWDLNSRKAWCELRCETTGQAVADICWNPSQGLHLMTASLDDRNPVLKLWDLRASTSMPLATLAGHTKGILKTAWCGHDDTLLLSCGKDNRTILWDLFTLRPIADIPNDVPTVTPDEDNNSNSAMFGASGLAPAQQRRYDVQWSPIKRGVLACCSLDRKVQVHSVIGLATQSGRPPKWMKPSSSVSCGYGGTVVSCGAPDKFVRLRTIVEQPELVQASNAFEADIAAVNVVDFCHVRAASAKTQQEQQTWGFMKVMFESNARQHLLGHLGFDAEKIAQLATEYTENGENGVASMSLEDKVGGMSKPAENAVKEALLVGNFEAAVECCFRTGNLADALILASCGGADLWSKTQERYFAKEAPKRPFLSIVNAVIRNQLEGLVANSDAAGWKETLAMLSTYGQSDEFPKLCIQLGDRLAAVGDHHGANLCYMCSLSLEHSVRFWLSQLHAANKRKGSLDLLALHEFVVKVTVFLKASGDSGKLSDEIADLFSKYAGALADQGLLVTAAQYCRGESTVSKILRDRLYRSRSSQMCFRALGSPPEFPFSMVTVNKGQASASTTTQRQRQQNQSSQYSQQQTSYGQQPSRYAQQQAGYSQQQPIYSQPQPSYSQQQSSAATQASAPSIAQSASATTPQLPAGWVALQDPSSGNTYYANQTTGETTWEMPQAVLANQGATGAAASQTQTGMQSQYSSASAPAPAPAPIPAASSTNNTLASKYGDGFVTSASHPELASQYGNVGTSNPYTGVARPGIAQVTPGNKPPVSGTLNFNSVELSPEHMPIKDGLLSIVSSLGSSPMTAADKRQLSEAEKGVAILVKRLARGDIPDDVSSKVMNLVNALFNRDYNTTMAIQKDLVNHDWKDHKDWLKGVKFLIQLTSKRL